MPEGESPKPPEPIVNYLKVSELLLSNAISRPEQISEQIRDTLDDSDLNTLGIDIPEKVVNLAIKFSTKEDLSLQEIAKELDIKDDEVHQKALKELLFKTGFFISESKDQEDKLSYSSPDLQKIFRHLYKSDFDPNTINFDFKDYSAHPRVLWNIPGQVAMIGPIDAEDAKTIYRFYILERWRKFKETFVDQTTKTMKKLISSNSSTYEELDLSNRFNKMYGIFGGKNGIPEEVGELQGGSFIYSPSYNSLKVIEESPKLIQKIEKISTSDFSPRHLTEISWFKSPYAQDKHVGAGIRQIIARENLPTQIQEIEMRNPLPEKGHKKDHKNYILIAFILPTNEDSIHLASSVGMEVAGEIDRVEDGIKEHVEVWVLNRDKLNNRIFEDLKKSNGIKALSESAIVNKKL